MYWAIEILLEVDWYFLFVLFLIKVRRLIEDLLSIYTQILTTDGCK